MSVSTVSTETSFLIAFALVTCVLSVPQYLDNRILGGHSVTIEEYPYQLALEGGNRHICGGSILTKKWALTAAHCVYNQPVKWLRFRSGSTFRENGGYLHYVLRYIFHREYNRTTVDYDIAVVLVNEPFHTKPITLPLKVPLYGDPVTILGWGYLEKERLKKPNELRASDIVVIDWEVCKARYYPSLTSRMMCAGGAEEDICSGDSGGPLIRGYSQQVGISSWSYKCGQGASVYTNISVFFPWIIANTGMEDYIFFPDH